MKKRIIFCSVLLLCAMFLLGGCNNQTVPTESPAPSPAAQATPTVVPEPDGPVHIDSPLVGQWVPVGVQGSGYLLFQEDGTVVRFEVRENADPLIQEQRYEVLNDNTFRMIYPDNTASHAFEFEVINDGKTLNIYDPTVGIRMPSEFYRIDDTGNTDE